MSRRTIWHGSLASLVAIRDSDLYARKLKPLPVARWNYSLPLATAGNEDLYRPLSRHGGRCKAEGLPYLGYNWGGLRTRRMPCTA